MIRRTRLVSVAGIVAMVMAVLAVCPCPPAMATAADAHGCCAGKAGLKVSSTAPSCCMTEARDPQLADALPTPAPLAVSATLDTVVSAVPVPSCVPPAIAPAPPPAAPVILRV